MREIKITKSDIDKYLNFLNDVKAEIETQNSIITNQRRQ